MTGNTTYTAFFTESTNIQQNYQYSISYRHTSTWDEDAINPSEDYDATAFPITRSKLANKEAFTVGFYGDSITDGGNQTGPYNVSPYTPHWRTVIVDMLEDLYGYTDTKISIRNHARGGTTSVRGAHGGASGEPTIQDGFAAHIFKKDETLPNDGIPTLFILAYGMNDEYTPIADFKANIKSIVNQILTINPDCEFLLVSTALPNPLWDRFSNREQHETILEEVVTELRQQNVSIDCAKLQSMHKHILTKKAFRDMSGNNVNHQNDMLSRLYAQTLLAYITDRYNAE